MTSAQCTVIIASTIIGVFLRPDRLCMSNKLPEPDSFLATVEEVTESRLLVNEHRNGDRDPPSDGRNHLLVGASAILKIETRDGRPRTLAKGQTIRVWTNGLVADTDPGQVFALRILIEADMAPNPGIEKK